MRLFPIEALSFPHRYEETGLSEVPKSKFPLETSGEAFESTDLLGVI